MIDGYIDYNRQVNRLIDEYMKRLIDRYIDGQKDKYILQIRIVNFLSSSSFCNFLNDTAVRKSIFFLDKTCLELKVWQT